MGTIAPNKLRG